MLDTCDDEEEEKNRRPFLYNNKNDTSYAIFDKTKPKKSNTQRVSQAKNLKAPPSVEC